MIPNKFLTNYFRYIIIGISVLLSTANLSGQINYRYNEEAERTFSNAIHLLNNRDDAGALRLFQRMIEMQPVHQRTTAAYLMAGKTLHRLDRYTESIRLLKLFIKTYEKSTYRHNAEYTLAVDYLMVQQPTEAIIHLVQALDDSTGRFERKDSFALLQSIPPSRIEDSTLRAIYLQTQNNEVRDILALKLAEKDLHAGQIPNAESILNELIHRIPKSRYEQDAIRLKDKLSNVVNVKVGVVLPFMKKSDRNQLRSISEEIVDGIKFAIQNKLPVSEWDGSVTLEVRDSEKDPKVARREVKNLAADKDVIGIIGPLFSQEAQASALVAADEGLPLLTPTATANGIAGVGASVFQLNPDLENRAKAMAIFAVKHLGFTKLGILASGEATGKVLAEDFVKEARKLGATIVVNEVYTKGASDLSDQFYAIRKAGSRLEGKSEPSRYLDVPVHGIEGLFIPISDAEEIGVIASQLKYFNISTTILGNDEWYDRTQLDLNKRYLGHLYILSDTYIDERTAAYTDYSRSYLAAMKITPTKYSAIGYDAMNLLLSLIQSGADSRGKMNEGLARVHGYHGIHSMITLDHRRVNSELYILQFQDGMLQIVKDISIK